MIFIKEKASTGEMGERGAIFMASRCQTLWIHFTDTEDTRCNRGSRWKETQPAYILSNTKQRLNMYTQTNAHVYTVHEHIYISIHII